MLLIENMNEIETYTEPKREEDLQNFGVYYSKFLHWFVPSLIGVKKWKSQCTQTMLSNLITVADEAFLLSTIKLHKEKWDQTIKEIQEEKHRKRNDQRNNLESNSDTDDTTNNDSDMN